MLMEEYNVPKQGMIDPLTKQFLYNTVVDTGLLYGRRITNIDASTISELLFPKPFPKKHFCEKICMLIRISPGCYHFVQVM